MKFLIFYIAVFFRQIIPGMAPEAKLIIKTASCDYVKIAKLVFLVNFLLFCLRIQVDGNMPSGMVSEVNEKLSDCEEIIMRKVLSSGNLANASV